MSIQLKELALSGYRSYDNDFQSNRIEFAGMNVIIGANGAGKSNLVSFFEMVAFMMTKGLRDYIAKHGNMQSLLHFGPQWTEQIRGYLRFCDSGVKAEDTYSFALAPTATDQAYFAEERASYWDHANYAKPYERDFGVGHQESGMVDSDSKSIQIACKYLRQLRVFHFNDTSLSSRIRRGGDSADNAYLRSDGGNIAAFLYRIKEENNLYYNRIQQYVQAVLPQFLKFHLEKDSNGYIALRWQEAGNESVLAAHQMSDGTLRFIALMTLLLQPPDRLPGTIILDEPEIGLHPYALSVLVNAMHLAEKNAQLIIATQSPLLLNFFEPQDVIVAEYDPDRKSSRLHRCEEDKLREWLEDYSFGELWEKNVLGGTPL